MNSRSAPRVAAWAHDEQLEREFREVYRRPGVRHLLYACVFGGFTALTFYVIDLTLGGHNWIAGAQSLRLVLVAGYLGLAATCYWRAEFARRHYVALFVAACVGLSAVGCIASFLRNRDAPLLQLLWSIDMTLIVIVVVVHGFSRLSVWSTVAAANVCSVAVIAVLWTLPEVSALELRRIALHLLLVGAGCAWLRYCIEQRERELFAVAKDNLRRNEHTLELEAAMRSAKEADATKARFLAHMSHEIRTPMNGVLQILEVIGRRAAPDDRALIEKGQKAGHALLRILNGVLDYAKLAHEGVKVRPTFTDLRDVCRTAAHLHEASASVKSIEFRSDLALLADGDPHVMVDSVKLLEIINNLVGNGIKFTASGRVSLAMRLTRRSEEGRDGAWLVVEVEDSGPGMEPQELRQAFVPFFQSESPARRAGGSGLGLAIVKQLVGEMGGRIDTQSAVGRGTRFVVTLPVQRVALGPAVESGAAAVRPPPATDGEFHGRRVLMVDDNELNADLAAQILGMLGFSVDVALSGAGALDRLRGDRYDVVLMDCQMPEMDGYETVQLWRAAESAAQRPHTPIVAVTAFTLAGDRRKCIEAGMDDYLGKPYTASDLAATLRRWIATDRD
jgi:signal transduction histidine kinase/CheY-like chemotaxis protein